MRRDEAAQSMPAPFPSRRAMPSSSHDAQRIEHLDALRGVALFGILMVNIGVFASPWFGLGAADPAFDALLSLSRWWLRLRKHLPDSR